MTHSLVRRSLFGLVLVLVCFVPLALRPTATWSAAAPSVNGGEAAAQSPQLAAGNWYGWQNLGNLNGQAVHDPVIGQNMDGRLEIFAWGDYGSGPLDHSVYQRSETTVNGSNWSPWGSLGTLEAGILQPAVATNPAGRMEVFVLGAVTGGACTVRNEIKQIWQTAPNNGWSSWTQMGTPNPSFCYNSYEPYVGINGDGRLDVFALSDNGIFYHRWQIAPSGGWSPGWDGIGSPSGTSAISALSTGRNSDGRLQLFTGATNHEFYSTWQSSLGSETSWSGWTGFGKPSSTIGLYYPTLGQNQDGRLEIFGLGGDLNVWHKWQVAPNSYWSSSWASMGSPATANVNDKPKVSETRDGRLVIVAPANDGAIWYKAQMQPNGTWGSWISLGKPLGVPSLSNVTVARNQNGSMVVAALDPSGNLWWNYEAVQLFLPLLRR